MKLSTTEVIPPVGGAIVSGGYSVPKVYKECIAKPDKTKKCGPEKIISIDSGKEYKTSSFCKNWRPPTRETYVIPRIGLPAIILQAAAKAGKLDRSVKATEFLLNKEPAYAGPAWSDCFVILRVDDGTEDFGRYCPTSFYTDYRNEAILAITRAGVSDTLAQKLVMSQKRDVN